ncbi:hypothetical protein SISSUDRAFT_956598, partial [Sistotremastrum suecicum HHB10207 ss-3]
QSSLKPGTFIISASQETIEAYLQGYSKDIAFKSRWLDPKSSADEWYPGRRYYKDTSGLLYFRDADLKPRLCVPNSLRASLLRQYHESPITGGHAG